MNTMIATTNIRLISVKDLRPIDWETGKRLPIEDDQKNVCARCGKLHAKVYEVEADSVRYEVGSGCCNRMFGWEPEHDEVLSAEKIAKDRDIQAALQVIAQPIIDQVNAIPVPELRYHSSRWTCFGYEYIWTTFENEHLGIRVESKKMEPLPRKEIVLTDADRERFAQIWKRRQVREIVNNQFDAKKAKKLTVGILELMGINE